MTTEQRIITALDCTEMYAQKIIESCNGNIDEIRKLVTCKVQERNERAGVVEYDPGS